jgi:hypothetical protein
MISIIKNIFSFILITLLLFSCKKNECPIAVKGELKDYIGLDGCGFVIILENGDRIEPINLSEFDIELVDNQKIWVDYHINENLSASICMVGDIVVIDCISKR